jgi:predicted nucleotidyltransferase
MDAKPILVRVARALREQRLEAVLIGNSGAAIQGAPVTTLDIDFFIRKTPANITKLKRLAKSLGAVILTPFYPVSGLFRLARDEEALQLDFMTSIHGVRSFNTVRSRATAVDIEGETLLVAALADIIASKRAAGRPRDRAVLDVLEATLKQTEQEAQPRRDSPGPQGRE